MTKVKIPKWFAEEIELYKRSRIFDLEDLNEQGYSLGEKRKIWEKTKEARSLLTIKGFLTEAESQKVVNRMAKAIVKDIIKMEKLEE